MVVTSEAVKESLKPVNVLRFLESQTGEYDYESPLNCAIAQYLKSVFPGERMYVSGGRDSLHGTVWVDNVSEVIPDAVYEAIRPDPSVWESERWKEECVAMKSFAQAAKDLREFADIK